LLFGGLGRNRTTDTRIFSPLLYRLSYQAKYSFARATLLPVASALPRIALHGNPVHAAQSGALRNPALTQLSYQARNYCL
jgi:hypothetical protein